MIHGLNNTYCAKVLKTTWKEDVPKSNTKIIWTDVF
jgi:hypothetical protein